MAIGFPLGNASAGLAAQLAYLIKRRSCARHLRWQLLRVSVNVFENISKSETTHQTAPVLLAATHR